MATQNHVETHPHEVEIGGCEVSLSGRSGRRDSDSIVLGGAACIGTRVQDGANALICSRALDATTFWA